MALGGRSEGPTGVEAAELAPRGLRKEGARESTRHSSQPPWLPQRGWLAPELDRRQSLQAGLSNPVTGPRSNDACQCRAKDGAIAPLRFRFSPGTNGSSRSRCLPAIRAGLSQEATVHHLTVFRRFLDEVCSGGAALSKIRQGDRSATLSATSGTGARDEARRRADRTEPFSVTPHRELKERAASWVVVPSRRRWKLATLPTYLPAAQVRKAIEGRDRETVITARLPILLLLPRSALGPTRLRRSPDDIDWRTNEILVRAKGRQRA